MKQTSLIIVTAQCVISCYCSRLVSGTFFVFPACGGEAGPRIRDVKVSAMQDGFSTEMDSIAALSSKLADNVAASTPSALVEPLIQSPNMENAKEKIALMGQNLATMTGDLKAPIDPNSFSSELDSIVDLSSKLAAKVATSSTSGFVEPLAQSPGMENAREQFSLMGQNLATMTLRDLQLEDAVMRVDKALGISDHAPLYTAGLILYVGVTQRQAGYAAAKKQMVNKIVRGVATVDEVMEDINVSVDAARAKEAEVQRIVAETKAIAEERRAAAESKRIEQKKKAEKIAEERLKAQEAKKIEAKRLKEERQLANEAKKAEAKRLSEERLKAQEAKKIEAKRLKEERRLANEAKKAEAKRLSEERKAQMKKQSEERRMAKEAKRLQAKKQAEERHVANEAKKLRAKQQHEERKDQDAKLSEEKLHTAAQTDKIDTEMLKEKEIEEKKLLAKARVAAVEATKVEAVRRTAEKSATKKRIEKTSIRQNALAGNQHKTTPAAGTAVRASPLAKILAAELGLNLGDIPGTGLNGRVLADDVREYKVASEKPAPKSQVTEELFFAVKN